MKPYTLLKTTNYNMFKLAEYNRDVDLQHVRQLAKELKNGNKFIQPVIINEKMEIIDGQHRLKALQEVGQPVWYIIEPGTGKEDVISMNNVQRGWSIKNWIESFANTGNPDYRALLQEINKQRRLAVSPNMIAKVFASPYLSPLLGRIDSAKAIKTGEFKFDYENASHAEKVIEDAISLTIANQDSSKPVVRPILESVWMLESNPNFDFKCLYKKMAKDKFESIAKTSSSIEAALSLVEIYNYRKRKGQILAYKDAHGHLAFE